jgi:hypothetical protein
MGHELRTKPGFQYCFGFAPRVKPQYDLKFPDDGPAIYAVIIKIAGRHIMNVSRAKSYYCRSRTRRFFAC